MLQEPIEIIKRLQHAGYKAYIVGGYVRDTLLNLPAKDIDIATDAPSKEVKTILEGYKFIEVGESFNIVMVVTDLGKYEIATFRHDVYNTMDGRHPSEVVTSTEIEDAKRRDFTVNGIFYDPVRDEYIDHVGGELDIEKKVIRCIGNPEDRFSEDYLRMLRAIRFTAQLGFELEQSHLDIIKRLSPNIHKVSCERIYDELVKMTKLGGKPFHKCLILLDQTELLREILPEVAVLKDYFHDPKTHPEVYQGKHSVFAHVLEAIRISYVDHLTTLALLFHDVGKAVTYERREGKDTYYSHDIEGTKIIDKIGTRFRIDNYTINLFKFVCQHHMKFHNIQVMHKSKIYKMMKSLYFDNLVKVAKYDDMCRGFDDFDIEWEQKLTKIDEVLSSIEYYNLVEKKITGDLIMKIRDIPPSPLVGYFKDKAISIIIDKDMDIHNEKLVTGLIKGLSNPKPTFVMTIGIPGSGKSTWVGRQRDRFTVVSSDKVREELYGDVSEQGDVKKVWQVIRERVHSSLKRGEDVILDATNVDKKLRLKFLNGLPKCKKIAKVFKVSQEEAFARIQKDLDGKINRSNVPKGVVENMDNKFRGGYKTLKEQFDTVWE